MGRLPIFPSRPQPGWRCGRELLHGFRMASSDGVFESADGLRGLGSDEPAARQSCAEIIVPTLLEAGKRDSDESLVQDPRRPCPIGGGAHRVGGLGRKA